jgi:hypothetical protein
MNMDVKYIDIENEILKVLNTFSNDINNDLPLKKDLKKLGSIFGDIGNVVTGTVSTVTGAATSTVGSIGSVADLTSWLETNILSIFGKVIVPSMNTILSPLKDIIITVITQMGPKIMAVLKTITENPSIKQAIITVIKMIVKTLLSLSQSILEMLSLIIMTAFTSFIDIIKDPTKINSLINAINSVLTIIYKLLVSFEPFAEKIIVQVGSLIINSIMSIIGKLNLGCEYKYEKLGAFSMYNFNVNKNRKYLGATEISLESKISSLISPILNSLITAGDKVMVNISGNEGTQEIVADSLSKVITELTNTSFSTISNVIDSSNINALKDLKVFYEKYGKSIFTSLVSGLLNAVSLIMNSVVNTPTILNLFVKNGARAISILIKMSNIIISSFLINSLTQINNIILYFIKTGNDIFTNNLLSTIQTSINNMMDEILKNSSNIISIVKTALIEQLNNGINMISKTRDEMIKSIQEMSDQLLLILDKEINDVLNVSNTLTPIINDISNQALNRLTTIQTNIINRSVDSFITLYDNMVIEAENIISSAVNQNSFFSIKNLLAFLISNKGLIFVCVFIIFMIFMMKEYLNVL